MILYFLLISTVACQYGPSDNLLPMAPPGMMPPMPPLDPTTPNPRAPPLPTWVDRINEDGILESNDGSGSGSGLGMDSSDGEEDFGGSSGSGSGDDLKFADIMSQLDEEAEEEGVNCPIDVVFIVDATASVKQLFKEYIKFILKVLNGLDVSESIDHIGVMVYSSHLKQRVKIPLGSKNTQAQMYYAINNLPFFSGITATGKALEFASEHTENRRDNVTLNFVVLTDGYSYDLIDRGARMLRAVPNSKIFAVSIGESFVGPELEMITGDPERVLNGATSYGSLVKKMKFCEARKKAKELHEEQLNKGPETFLPGEFIDGQGRRIIPPQPIDPAVIKAINTNEINPVITEQPIKDCVYDIGLIFDASGSLKNNFQEQLRLADSLVAQLPIAQNSTLVAIVQFAGRTKTRILSTFTNPLTKSGLKNVISKARFFSGTTYANTPLLKMAKLFEEGRSLAKKRLLIFTDGYSAEDTTEGVKLLKTLGVEIFTIGITTANGASLNINELETMASSPANCYNAENFDKILKRLPSSQYCQ